MQPAASVAVAPANLGELDPTRKYHDAFETDFTERLTRLAATNKGDYFELVLDQSITDEERKRPGNSTCDCLGRFYNSQRWQYFRDLSYSDLVKLVEKKRPPIVLTNHPWVAAQYLDNERPHRIRFTKNSEQEERVQATVCEPDPTNVTLSFQFYYNEKMRYQRSGIGLKQAIEELLTRGRDHDYVTAKVEFNAKAYSIFGNRLKDLVFKSLGSDLQAIWNGDIQSFFETAFNKQVPVVPAHQRLKYSPSYDTNWMCMFFEIKEDEYWMNDTSAGPQPGNL